MNESYSNRWDDVQRSKTDEVGKLQSVINDQNNLLSSCEKMLEKERQEAQEKVTAMLEQVDSYKDEVFDLNTKNTYLNTKLHECQEELVNIQSEINTTLTREETKHLRLFDQASELEQDNAAKAVV